MRSRGCHSIASRGSLDHHRGSLHPPGSARLSAGPDLAMATVTGGVVPQGTSKSSHARRTRQV